MGEVLGRRPAKPWTVNRFMTRPNTEPNPQLHSRSDPWYVCYVQLCYVFGLCEEEIVPEKKDYTNFPMKKPWPVPGTDPVMFLL